MINYKERCLFISTNNIWSGSEELWFGTAKELIKDGKSVSVIANYTHQNINLLALDGIKCYNLNNRFSLLSKAKRLLNRILPVFANKDLWKENLIINKPNLVIISQGNNIDSLEWMELLNNLEIKFCTITQLVSELHLLFLNSEKQNKLSQLYKASIKNFFVSADNLKIHQMMMTDKSSINNSIIYNPYLLNSQNSSYPDSENGYHIAYVGRLECYHKGLDILIQVLSQEKWQNRNVIFNFYGDGPHKEIIEKMILTFGIKNIILKGFSTNVSDIWANNHALVLPSRMEGQALSLIEALNCNRVAIVTNVGGSSNLIKDNETGYIAANANFNDIDDALERAWFRRREWEQIGKIAGEHIKTIIPNNAIDHFKQQLGKLLLRKTD
jgi:glycosyltransferase involved in cell wall biosynthesis